ncbi:response regulator [Deinococcus piscis]|nr:response regulator [Deinococcus piscis]
MSSRLRFFIIDDDATDVELTTAVLGQYAEDVEVFSCHGGACPGNAEVMQTLEALDQTPSLILLDIHMPPQSGLDILNVLKAHPVYRLIPVIVLSNSQEQEDIQEAYRRHASAYLVKGSDFETFTAQMHALLRFWRYCLPAVSSEQG